jgi:HEAT repeat protein
VRDLGDKNQNIQNRARYALVKFGEQAVEPLIKSLKSNNKAQKREAAYALGEIKDARAIDPLIDLLNSNEEGVSWAAAGALSCYVDPKAEKALVNALKFKDGYFNSTLSNLLIKKDKRVVDFLLLLLNDSDERVRSQVAYIFAQIKDARVVDILISLLVDHNSEVRKNAALGLYLHPNEKAIEPLILTWNDNNSEVRTKASDALVAIGSSATNQLIMALKSTNPYVRWRAALCLGRIGNPSSVDALLVTLNDKVSEVRWTGINALELLKDERAVSKLLVLCYDSDSGIRAKTESALTVITGSNDCLKVKQETERHQIIH